MATILIIAAVVAGIAIWRTRAARTVTGPRRYGAPAFGDAVLQSWLDDELARADAIVQAYAAVLQDQSPAKWYPESRLPAPKEATKTALLRVASYWRIRKELTAESLASFRTSYALLSTFVNEGEADAANAVVDAAKGYQEGGKTHEALLAAARQISAANDSLGNLTERTNNEHRALLQEFDRRFEQMRVMAEGSNASTV